MFKKSNKTTPYHSFTYLKAFIVVVLIGIAVALGYRFSVLIQTSRFNDSFFTLLVDNGSIHVLTVNQENKTIIDIKLQDVEKLPNSIAQTSYYLGIPIDAIVTYKDKKNSDIISEIKSLSFATSFFTLPFKYSLIGVNQLDMAKIYFASTFQNAQIEHINVTVSQEKNVKTNVLGISSQNAKNLYEYTKDPNIINENKTIEIINASKVDGMGTKVASILRSGGFNIIAIKTATKIEKGKIIARGHPSKTTNKLQKILHLTSVYQQEEAIADITVIIGSEYSKIVLRKGDL